jgi:dipeptidyl aminopeptidase/acylaminoacyl peptidase
MHIPFFRFAAFAAALTLSSSLLAADLASPDLPHVERGNLVFEGIPRPDPEIAAHLQRYQQSRSATFLDWLPDGGMLIATRFGDVEQVHQLAAPSGMREQLTYSSDPITVARAAPTAPSTRFVFLRDEGGDENSQLYYYAGPGNVRQLTHGKFIHGNPVWSHDGKHVAFYGNDRDGASYDIYLADIDSSAPNITLPASAPVSGAAPVDTTVAAAAAVAPTAPATSATTVPPLRLIVGGQQDTWYPLDWSLDDRKLLLWKYLSIDESYLYIADIYTGTLTPVDPSGHKIGISSAKFAPDGRGVYVVSDEDSEFQQLRYVDPVTHDVRKITQNIQWDVERFDVSADGRYIAYVVNEDGRSRLTVLDTAQKLELSPAGLPEGRIINAHFDRAGKRLAITAESSRSPSDVYVFDLEHSKLERWTHSETGPVNPNTFVPAELVRYPTWDRVNGKQRMLSAYVYRPRTAGPYPVVVDIHGGPEAQARAEWDPFTQYLVNELGYAVIAPNVRGSSGYGKTFLKLDNGVLREDAVRDIGALLVWIGLQPVFDREHVVVMGSSYGGYMALASLAAYSDRLRGGVDVVGISNFVSFLASTAAYRQDLRRAEYGDERDPKMRAFLERVSPLNNASSIRKPLLVVQGLNDPRVPASESLQMVYRIRSNGGEVWYLAAKDEGHGFRKKANRDVYLETVAQFLQRLAGK